jgi:hypothetical protein
MSSCQNKLTRQLHAVETNKKSSCKGSGRKRLQRTQEGCADVVREREWDTVALLPSLEIDVGEALRRSGRFKGVWGKGFERHRHGREEREG